jgi:DNA-binding LacI/PurR family transcriptional regulator
MGRILLVSFQQLSDDWHADYENSMKADGLILLGYGDYLAYQSTLDRLVEQGTHFVRWGAVLPGQPGVSIGCDNFHGGQLVGEHLYALGRRKVAFLGDASRITRNSSRGIAAAASRCMTRACRDGSGVAGRCGELGRSRVCGGADVAVARRCRSMRCSRRAT